MNSFAAVVLLAAAASAATVPVYQNVYPEVQAKDAVVPAVSTSHVYRSSVVSPVVPAQGVAYPQHVAYAGQTAYAAPVAYAAQPAYAAPVAYAAQPVAYGAQPVAYAGQPAYGHYGYVQPAVHGYVAQQSYVAPAVRV